MVGTPRNRSVYAMAIARSGKNTGPGRLRSTAIPSASARMSTSATRKIFTSSQNADRTSGNQARTSSPLKNFCLTSSHPGERTTRIVISVKTTIVLSRPTATFRPAPPPRIRDPRSPVCAASSMQVRLVEDGRSDDVGEPLLLDLIQRAVCLQRVNCAGDAGRQRAALVEHEAPLILPAGAGELADDGAAARIDERDVVGRREVDDQSVDLAVHQRLCGVTGAGVDVGLLVRLDHLGDRVEA